MSDRVIGYILLALGLIVMVYATAQIIAIVTGNAKPIQVFTMESEDAADSSSSMNDLLLQFQQSAASAGGPQNSLPSLQLFDPKALNEIINLTVYFFIMQFLLGLGYKFSSLGVQMLRPIVVQVKNKKLEQVISEEQPEKTHS